MLDIHLIYITLIIVQKNIFASATKTLGFYYHLA